MISRSVSLQHIAMFALLAVCTAFGSPHSLWAQNNNGNGGITIDADGLVNPVQLKVNLRLLKQKQAAFVKDTLNGDLSEESEIRKVSLVKLEQRCVQCLNEGIPFPPDVFYVAGLTQIDYLFFDTEQKDIIIAGPAGAFAPDPIDRMLNVKTGRPVIRLDDLVVALRTAFSQKNIVGCSIDPKPQNLAALQKEVSRTVPIAPAAVNARFQHLTRILGEHDVKVLGVPDDTHFSQILVAADYRMKRLSIGMEPTTIRKLPSHLTMLRSSANALQRWWFVPYYEEISTTPLRDAFELKGQRAQLLSQDEVSDANGVRSSALTTKASTQKWAQLFTTHFEELAEKKPVFAELQNLIDLVIISELIVKEGMPEKIGWSMSVIKDESKIKTSGFAVPKKTQAMYRFKQGRPVIGLITGGVTINSRQVLKNVAQKIDPASRLTGVKNLHLGKQNASPPADENKGATQKNTGYFLVGLVLEFCR